MNISLNKDLQSVYRIFHTTETVLLKIESNMLESLDNSCVALKMYSESPEQLSNG